MRQKNEVTMDIHHIYEYCNTDGMSIEQAQASLLSPVSICDQLSPAVQLFRNESFN